MNVRPILSALSRHKTAAALIVFEIAVTCAIVCNALFLIAQRVETVTQPSGVAEDRLLEINVGGIGTITDGDARTAQDLAALRAIPGVAAVTMANQLPFFDSSSNSGIGLVPDQEEDTRNVAQYMGDNIVDTFGLKLVAGRDFRPDEIRLGTELDHILETAPKTLSAPIIVSRTLAQQLFPGESAVGKVVYTGYVPLTIVGVVETLARPHQNGGFGARDESLILPVRLRFNDAYFFIRATDPARRDEVLKAGVDALLKNDPNRLILRQRSYEQSRADFFRNDTSMVWLMSLVCIALMLVTAVGIVGLASFWVQQRTKQIGIRRALGATRGQVLRYFQTENFLLASLGIVLGMLLAYAINQLLMNRYELPRLPLLYLPVGALLLWGLGQIAVLGPARRAAAVPPAVATRST